MSDEKRAIAIVENIIENGAHGPYVVTRYLDEETGEVIKITFSLRKKGVWKEKSRPETGSMVVLSQFVKKPRGWRAEKARYYTLKDEQSKKGAVSR